MAGAVEEAIGQSVNELLQTTYVLTADGERILRWLNVAPGKGR